MQRAIGRNFDYVLNINGLQPFGRGKQVHSWFVSSLFCKFLRVSVNQLLRIKLIRPISDLLG